MFQPYDFLIPSTHLVYSHLHDIPDVISSTFQCPFLSLFQVLAPLIPRSKISSFDLALPVIESWLFDFFKPWFPHRQYCSFLSYRVVLSTAGEGAGRIRSGSRSPSQEETGMGSGTGIKNVFPWSIIHLFLFLFHQLLSLWLETCFSDQKSRQTPLMIYSSLFYSFHSQDFIFHFSSPLNSSTWTRHWHLIPPPPQ